MKKEHWFKIILIVGLIMTCIAIYNDKQKIEAIRVALAESQHAVSELGKENQALQLQLDNCCGKDTISAVNGVYTPAQMDEMDRRIKAHENQ